MRVYLLQGKTEEAVAKLEAAISANPQNQSAYITLANLYEQRGNRDKAKTLYGRALEANPDMWPAANNLAYLIAESAPHAADLEKASQLAKQAFKLQPENPVVLDTLGWVAYRQGNLPLALNHIENALEKNRDSPLLNYHLAVVLHADGRNMEARSALDKALNTAEDFHGRAAAEQLLIKLKSEP